MDNHTHTRTAQQPLPPPIARRLGALLYVAAEEAQEAGNAALEPLGLTVKHFGVLTFLRHETEALSVAHRRHHQRLTRGGGASKPPTQGGIGERLRIDRTTMVTLIDDLESAGYVQRMRNPDDRRAYIIALTPAGKRVQARAEKALDERSNLFFSALSEKEQAELGDFLMRLIPSAHEDESVPQ